MKVSATPIPVTPQREGGAAPRALTDGTLPAAAIALAATVLIILSDLPGMVAIAPALALMVIVCARWPSLTVVGVIAVTGTAGSLTAFTPVPPNGAVTLFLIALWIVVGWQLLTRRFERRLSLWPGVLLPALFIALSAIWVFVGADTVGLGLESYRHSTWLMAALLLVAVAPWSPSAHQRIARGAALVFLCVGAYAVLRKVVGPAEAEVTVARANAIGLPMNQPAPFTGSFLHADDLAAYCAIAIPFALALALGWRDRWRLVAIAAVALCSFGLLAADRRAAAVGAVAGVVVTIAVFALCARAFRGRQIALAVLATVAVAGVGTAAYMTTIADDPAASQRFETLLTDPGQDPAYQTRLGRWGVVVNSLDRYPLGHGLGTSGAVLQNRRDDLPPDTINPILDSSFLKIAYEQGLVMLVLFGLAYLALLGGLAWRAGQAADPRRATLAIGACGILGAMLPIFYANMFIERPTIVVAWLLVGIAAAAYTRTAIPPRPPKAARDGAGDRPVRQGPEQRPGMIPVAGPS